MNIVRKKFFPQSAASVDRQPDLQRIVVKADPSSERATRMRSIAHDVSSALRSIKCAAWIPIEGGRQVSWLLANIAYALAETQTSVCLVEADFRNPQLASVFDIPTGAGLGNALEDKASIPAALYKIHSRLAMIPAGTFHGDIVGLLSSSSFSSLLEELASIYDLTLVISSSAALYLDYSFISCSCPAAVLVAQKNKCKMTDVTATKKQLEKLNVPLAYALLA